MFFGVLRLGEPTICFGVLRPGEPMFFGVFWVGEPTRFEGDPTIFEGDFMAPTASFLEAGLRE